MREIYTLDIANYGLHLEFPDKDALVAELSRYFIQQDMYTVALLTSFDTFRLGSLVRNGKTYPCQVAENQFKGFKTACYKIN